jgi:hypothetical protein
MRSKVRSEPLDNRTFIGKNLVKPILGSTRGSRKMNDESSKTSTIQEE